MNTEFSEVNLTIDVYRSTISILNMFIDKKTLHDLTQVVKSRLGLAALDIEIKNLIDYSLTKCKDS